MYKIQRSRHRKKHVNYIEEALEEARKSNMNHKHGAVIINGDRIVGRGYNYETFSKTFHKYGNRYSVHAEVAALNSVNDQRKDLKGAIMYVVRMPSHLKPSDLVTVGSLPCHSCLRKINRFMIKYKLKAVYYS